jgi:hypothetical protein
MAIANAFLALATAGFIGRINATDHPKTDRLVVIRTTGKELSN